MTIHFPIHESIFEHNPNAVFSFDLEGHFTSANDSALEISGYSLSELIGKKFDFLIPSEHLEEITFHFQNAVSGKVQHYETKILKKNGSSIYLKIINTPIHVKGEVVGIYGIAEDITERKLQELALQESEEKYRLLVESSPEMIAVHQNGKFVYINPTGVKLLRANSADDIIGKSVTDFVHEDYREMVLKEITSVQTGISVPPMEEKVLCLDGSSVDVEVRRTLIMHEEKPANQVIVRDISVRKHYEERVSSQNKALLELAKNTSFNNGELLQTAKVITEISSRTLCVPFVGIWIFNHDRSTLVCLDHYDSVKSEHACLPEIPTSDIPLYLTILSESRVVDVEDVESDSRMREIIEKIPIMPVKSFLDSLVHLNGEMFGVIVHSVVEGTRKWTPDEKSFVASLADLFTLCVERSERKKAEELVSHMAYHDPLTGIANRRNFEESLERTFNQIKNEEGMLSVLYIDMDRFKIINDTMGHAVGDIVLSKITGRLLNCVRKGDLVARMGGDEFAILLPKINRNSDAISVAKRIVKAFQSPIIVEQNEFHTTASVGISYFPDSGSDPMSVLKNADSAMYRAKELGKNNFKVYTKDMNEASLERMSIESDLRKAIKREEFLLYYQPKVSLSTGLITGIEALLRWNRGDDGFISPVSFIPIAEETGIIAEIGEWVLRNACFQARKLQRKGITSVRTSVNLSLIQFLRGDLVKITKEILNETGLCGEFLEFEITESILAHDSSSISCTLRELQSLGIHISIDDFGTGYSSFSYLRKLPIETIKIDRSFIKDVPNNSDDCAIASAIIAMSKSLRLKCIAEGVETMEQFQFLKSIGCDEMQGFFFSKPLPFEELESILLKKESFNPIS